MPALALTDLAQRVRPGQVLPRRARRRRQADRRLRRLGHARAERDQPYRAAAARDRRTRATCKLCDWLTRAYRGNQHRGRAEMRREWFDEGTDGLIALSGARDGDVGQALLHGNAAAARAPRALRWRAFRDRYYLEVQRAGHADDDALVDATVRARRASSRCRSWRRIRCSSCGATIFARTRRASASPRATCSPTRAGRGASRPSSTSRRRHEMAAKFADLPRGARQQRRDRAALQPDDRARQEPPAGVPDARRASRSTSTCGSEAEAGLERRLAQLYPDAATRDAQRAEYAARLEFETAPSSRWASPATS